MKLGDLAFYFDQIMFEGDGLAVPKAKGFVIGKRGKQLFWYLNPTRNGYYAVYPQYENGEIGHPRYYPSEKEITVKYIKK